MKSIEDPAVQVYKRLVISQISNSKEATGEMPTTAIHAKLN